MHPDERNDVPDIVLLDWDGSTHNRLHHVVFTIVAKTM